MAIRPKTQVGTIDCVCCGHEVPVKMAESGTLNLSCPWCDFPAYAKVNTEAHKIISRRMRAITKPIPDELKPPPPKPEPAAVKQSGTIFG